MERVLIKGVCYGFMISVFVGGEFMPSFMLPRLDIEGEVLLVLYGDSTL